MNNYLSKKELQKKLGVSLPTISRWMRDGKIPFLKIGKRVLFDPQKVEEHLDKNFTVTTNNSKA